MDGNLYKKGAFCTSRCSWQDFSFYGRKENKFGCWQKGSGAEQHICVYSLVLLNLYVSERTVIRFVCFVFLSYLSLKIQNEQILVPSVFITVSFHWEKLCWNLLLWNSVLWFWRFKDSSELQMCIDAVVLLTVWFAVNWRSPTCGQGGNPGLRASKDS